MHSRRDFGRLAAAAILSAPLIGTARAQAGTPNVVGGVRLGVCVGSYQDIPRGDDQSAYIERLAQAVAASGAAPGGLLEYHNRQLEPSTRLYEQARRGQPAPPPLSDAEFRTLREDRRQWRINTPVSYFEGVRRSFERAGLASFAYSFNFTPDMTDGEIDSVFAATRALGCPVISTNATPVEMGRRLAAFAARYRIDLGFHNHSNYQDPNQVASLESFATLLAISDRCKANLDVGHFTASNLDAVAFIKEHHPKITHLHMKDRKRNKGPGTPWGQGDAPLKEVLLLLKAERYPIPALVEYEYPGSGSIEEDRKCLDYMRAVLA
ncbi:sugar phosphate isomerase/epimerase family protein [Sphingomonas quercus]|uniref:Sugar phosphate isomerase/epimerase n=1 Tax=Sphingomonas quercus TaxID=2842451 RepID=A0ABS6BGS8_9SPHN|nr:sugar phosphate isomerase/epimerase [Sphingomonas quercus]MBU3077510.1 sugar phosphate isomerase/epimerase [Sphingomonas quercus]